MNDLVHFSAEPLTHVYDCEPHPERWYHKPRGLWLSVGEAWAEWCRDNSYGLGCYVTRVELGPAANILTLRSPGELDSFTWRYRIRDDHRLDEHIDWRRVMADYDGILIPEYHWSRRMDLMWYYSWDVASGCIWRARAIASLSESLDLTPLAKQLTA